MRLLLAAFGALWALTPALAAPSEAPPVSLRELPTVVERWAYAGGSGSMVLTGDRLVVADDKAVASLDAGSGRARWRTAVDAGHCFECPLTVIGEEVAYAVGEKLYL